MKLAFSGQPCGTKPLPPSSPPSSLDPELRARLLQEARTPWRGVRRALWLAFTASAALGLMTMAMRSASGSGVEVNDLLIQVAALAICGSLLWFDRARS
jgi:hypothetical protein